MCKKRYFLATSTIFLSLFLGCSSILPESEPIEVKAARIHDKALTIDTHVDTPMRLSRPEFNLGERHDPRLGGGKVDLPRMKEGGLDAIFFAVFTRQGARTPEGNNRAKEEALRTFNAIHKAVETHSNMAELAFTPDDAYRIEKTGKRAIYIGLENGYPIMNDLSLIKQYYDLGARYITLCHTSNNDICDSSTDEPEHNGLSDFGEKVVAEMNRLGMLVDISHISDESVYDVLEVSKAPVIASHSCARALCDNPRNLNDDLLKKIAENGGVIQMCILSSYVKTPVRNPERDAALRALRNKYRNLSEFSEEDREKERTAIEEKYPRQSANVSDVVNHIDHIVKIAGIDHVGIGTDFDGGGGLDGCYDVSEMGNITLELVRRGYTEKEIRKIWGGNFMRVFREVIKVADKLQSVP